MPKLNIGSKEYKDSKGQLYKPLFCRYVSLEIWRDLEKIMADQKLNLTEAICWSVKRSLGK